MIDDDDDLAYDIKETLAERAVVDKLRHKQIHQWTAASSMEEKRQRVSALED